MDLLQFQYSLTKKEFEEKIKIGKLLGILVLLPQVEGKVTSDRIKFEGIQSLNLEMMPESPGSIGTALIAMNMLSILSQLKSGILQ